ncbi:DUF4129 domain-containing protein [Brevibacillus migulae]|uniref:DUF4129 domain-containing protein n=1 Tax=Brevibacillus migulae TaxID=1644114 RepID=UPI00106E1E90|nr:DUF4129 domain-containing protein [Brevibacillus migulae]
MNRRMLWRWMAIFWLEALMAAGLLSLFGYLATRFWPMLAFSAAAAGLLGLGAWLYQGGGRSMWIHLLLYPLIAFAGIAAYLGFDSWIAALAIAGAFYWRIHTIVTMRLYHFDLLRRFGLATLIFLASLIYQALYVSLSESTTGVSDLFGMLSVLLLTYLITSEGEFLTREKPAGLSVPAALRLRIAAELGQIKLVGLAAYLAIVSALLFAGSVLWSLVKNPLGSLLFTVFAPLLALIEQWINQLAQILSKDQRIDLVTGNDGQPGNTIDHGMSGQEETLFSLLQPYLIALIVLGFAIWLGRKMWQRRYPAGMPVEQAHSAGASGRISPVEAQGKAGSGLGGMVQSFMERFSAPKDDQARYLYYQFLRYMKAQGMPMQKDETSQEFLLRIGQKWGNDRRFALISQITDLYHRHRYQQQALSKEELAHLESCFQALKNG